MASSSDLCIIGGGIAGLSLARECAAAGASVTIVERGVAGFGAAHVAAGMLAPVVEARQSESDIARFGRSSLEFYPGFVSALEQESGIAVDYRQEGTLFVGRDRDEALQIRHLYDEQVALGLPVEWLSGYECRQLEPGLAPSISGGVFSRHDHQVDTRLLLQALLRSCREHYKVRVVEGAGEGELVSTPSGVRYVAEGGTYEAERFVVATGAYMSLLGSALPELARAIRPIKGQILRLDQSRFPVVEHVVRTPRMYLAPKHGGSLVLGATAEEKGFDESITAGEIMELLRRAWEILPGIFDLPIAEISVGFRPATVDYSPLLGPTADERIWLATGYYRHGVLFSPYAASVLASALVTGDRGEWLERFSPSRLHETATERAGDRA